MKDYFKENAYSLFSKPFCACKEAFINVHRIPNYVVPKDKTLEEVIMETTLWTHPYTNLSFDLLESEQKKHQVYYPYEDSKLGLFYFSVPNPKGSVLLVPGGAYGLVCTYPDGFAKAKDILALGYNCFIVMYRTNVEASFPNVIVDFRKAMDVIYDKKNNFELGEKLILMGFSAGGHLASLVCRKDIASTYGIPRFKYLVLGYPVISLENNTHIETRDYFLGKYKDDPYYRHYFSTSNFIDKDYPVTFLWRSEDDPSVPISNSDEFELALKEKQVPHMYKIYPGKVHGLDMNLNKSRYCWINPALDFFAKNPR